MATLDVDAAIAFALKEMGYSSLRPDQEKVVVAFMKGKDVFVSLPTGSGKSLCYSILPKVSDSIRSSPGKCIVIVVSPLIALMKDQVRSMMDKGVSSIYTGDIDSGSEEKLCEGGYQLIFISPENLLSSMYWRDMLLSPVYQDNIVGLAVDEAHCVTKW